MQIVFDDETDVRAVLSDACFAVPPVPTGAPGGLEWLRANVARFSNGPAHERRRALVTAELARMSPESLRHNASQRAGGDLEHVAVRVLAEALGAPGVSAEAVGVVARSYHPGTESQPAADVAVATLVQNFGGTPDESTAARIGLLVQACAATAALIVNAERLMRRLPGGTPIDSVIAETLRDDPPVRVTRRVAVAAARVGGVEIAAGTPVHLDLAHLTFGAGPRRCPGEEHARQIAAGILEARR